ncbi:hypothetical protein JCM6882_007900 [Rhodosporidiobolus microsporus]
MSDTLHVHYESPSPLNLPPELLIKIAEVAVSLSPSNDESIVELENARAISFCCHALRDVGQKRLFRRIKTDKQLEEVKKSARLAGFVEEVEWMFCDKDEKTIPQRVGALTILVGSCANLLYVTLPYIPFLFLPTVLFYLSSVRAAGALTNLHLGCSGNGATNWNGTDLPLFLHALTTFRSLRSLTLDLDLDRIFPPEPETWAASYASLPPPPELALDDEEEGANEPTASPVYFPFLTHLVLIQHNWSTAVASGLLTLLLPTVENVELRDHGVDEAAFFPPTRVAGTTSDEVVALYSFLSRLPRSLKELRMVSVTIASGATMNGGAFTAALNAMSGNLETVTASTEDCQTCWTRRRDGTWKRLDLDVLFNFALELDL